MYLIFLKNTYYYFIFRTDNLQDVKQKNILLEKKIKEYDEEIFNLKDKLNLTQRNFIKQEMNYKDEIEKLKFQQNQIINHKEPLIKKEELKVDENEKNQKEIKNSDSSLEELNELKLLSETRLKTIEKYQEERLKLIEQIEKLEDQVNYFFFKKKNNN